MDLKYGYSDLIWWGTWAIMTLLSLANAHCIYKSRKLIKKVDEEIAKIINKEGD